MHAACAQRVGACQMYAACAHLLDASGLVRPPGLGGNPSGAPLLLPPTPLGIGMLGTYAQGSGIRVHGSGYRVQGTGFRVQGPGSRVQGPGSRVQGSGFRVQGSGFRAPGFGLRVQGSGLSAQGNRVQGSGLSAQGNRVQGSGSRVQGSGHRYMHICSPGVVWVFEFRVQRLLQV